MELDLQRRGDPLPQLAREADSRLRAQIRATGGQIPLGDSQCRAQLACSLNHLFSGALHRKGHPQHLQTPLNVPQVLMQLPLPWLGPWQ